MLLMVNIDDLNMENLPYIIEEILKRGAKNAHLINSVITKKGRVGIILFIDVEKKYLDRVVDYIVFDIGSIGIRIVETRHMSFDYIFQKIFIIIDDHNYSLNVKIVFRGKKKHVKAEFDNLKKISEDTFFPIDILKKVVESFAFSDNDEFKYSINKRNIFLKKE